MNTYNKGAIIITGDFCPVNRVDNLVTNGNYKSVFNDFLSYISDGDLVITNLECPLTDERSSIVKFGPSLKASVKTAEMLASSGFNLVTLANNHIMDYGGAGLNSTLNALRKNNINYLGAGKSRTEAGEIFTKKIGRYNIAVLNFAENEFSTTHCNCPGANPLDPVQNYNDIRKAKLNSDYVIVIVHGGHEHFNLPSPGIKKTFHFFADAGASIIIGHHSHCYSGYEIHNGVPIFYGLGNFVFDIPDKFNTNWNYGFAVKLSLGEELVFEIIPYEQCNGNVGLRLFHGIEKSKFIENIQLLSNILENDELLAIEFKKYCNKVKRKYLSYLEPYSARLIHFMHNRKLFPSLLSKRKKTLFLNLIRCESHREILIELLEKHTGTS